MRHLPPDSGVQSRDAYPDLLSVKDIQQITGFSSSAIVRWISTGILKAFQPGKQYIVPKDFTAI